MSNLRFRVSAAMGPRDGRGFRLEGFAGVSSDGKPWTMTVEEMFSRIAGGADFYVPDAFGGESKVTVVHRPGGERELQALDPLGRDHIALLRET